MTARIRDTTPPCESPRGAIAHLKEAARVRRNEQTRQHVQRLLGHRDKRKRLLLGHLHQDELGLQDHLALCLLVLGEGSAAARARARAAADALAVL